MVTRSAGGDIEQDTAYILNMVITRRRIFLGLCSGDLNQSTLDRFDLVLNTRVASFKTSQYRFSMARIKKYLHGENKTEK